MISGIQYREVQFKGMKITTSSPDNVVYLSETEILKVENIVHSTDGKVSLLGKKFVEKRNFFSYPMNSEDLSIFKVNTLSSTLSLHPLASVLFKGIKLPETFPANHDFIVFPLHVSCK